jgi:F-type H+-transporting ATPase subunit gamma
MSDTAVSLRHKIASAGELESVVRTMKAMAASSIGQYENAVRSLDDYYRTVQLGLIASFHQTAHAYSNMRAVQKDDVRVIAIVFGSDQGLVGQFNESMSEFALKTLKELAGGKIVWTVGERIQSRLVDADILPAKNFNLPSSISAITPLVGQILLEVEKLREHGTLPRLYLFHNSPQSGAVYAAKSQCLLPLDAIWRQDLADMSWPTKNLPEVMDGSEQTLLALLREYLFVSLFRTCAESLASENASRLAAMQRAEKNIDELLEDLQRNFHRLRQSGIDEELFDVVSGFEALSKHT